MLEQEVRMLHEKYRKAVQHWMEPWLESLGPDSILHDERIQLYKDKNFFANRFASAQSMRRFVEYEVRVEGDLRRLYLSTLSQMDQLGACFREEQNAKHDRIGLTNEPR